MKSESIGRRVIIRDELSWMLIATSAAAVISLALNLQAGFFSLLFLATAWWAWQCPEGGLLLFIVLAPVLPMFKVTQTVGVITLIKDVIIITMLLRCVVWPLINKSLPYRRNILLGPLALLGAWTLLEMFRADTLILGILRARDIGLYAFLYLAVLYLPHSEKRLGERMRWFIAVLLIVLALGLYQWFFARDSAVLRFDPAREIWIPRLSSVMAHPSILGEYLVMSLGLLAAIVIRNKNKLVRMRLSLLSAVIIFFIYLTYSRAVWLGLIIAGAAMGLAQLWPVIKRKTDIKKVAGYLVILFVALAAAGGLVYRYTPAGTFIRSAIDPSYGSNVERIEFTARLIAPLSNTEAILGKGLGDVVEQNFREVDLTTYDIASGASRSVQLTKNRTLVDNQYIKTFVEMGLVGILIYMWLYWRVAKYAVTASSIPLKAGAAAASKHKASGIIGLWAVGFLAAFVVQALFIDIWDIFPTNAYFWIVAALVSAALTPNALAEKKDKPENITPVIG